MKAKVYIPFKNFSFKVSK